MQALYVIIIVTIVQQFESNIISPRIMSSKLNIHPLTIIILILGVGNFAGIIGMILAVPVYAVTKTVVSNLVRLFKTKQVIENSICLERYTAFKWCIFSFIINVEKCTNVILLYIYYISNITVKLYDRPDKAMWNPSELSNHFLTTCYQHHNRLLSSFILLKNYR